MVLILLEVGERDLDDAALEGIVRVLETGCPVHKSLANTAANPSVPSSRDFVSGKVLQFDSLSDVEGVRSLSDA